MNTKEPNRYSTKSIAVFLCALLFLVDVRITDVYITDNKKLIGDYGLEEHDAHYDYYSMAHLQERCWGSNTCRQWIMPILYRVG
ncbi:MAG: hypothetical protein M3Z92_03980 [Bacteroidota bacterium]|nr:hypothetical protein [Bacteroidota bacterium]